MPAPDVDSHFKTDHLVADVGRRTVRGGALSFGAQLGKVVLQVATVVVMARLLPPAAFGLIAMVAVLNNLLDLVKDFGLSAATIRKPDITHEQVTALFWINVAAGAAIGAVLWVAAPWIARFYHQPELVAVTRWLSASFLMGGLSVQHWSLLRRQMRFGASAFIDVGSEVTGFVVAIACALAGAGYWALVAQRLAAPAFMLVATWSACRWRPGAPGFARGTGELVLFGGRVTGVYLANAFARSIDQVLIGWLYGAATLGLYDRANRLLQAPLNNFNVPFYAVAMPSFSRIAGDDARYRTAFCKLVENLAMIVVPGAAFVATTSDWFVRILLGPHWSGASPIVAAFAVAIAFQPLIQVMGLLFLTYDRTREMVRAALIDACLCVAAVLAGLKFGAPAVAASLAVVGVVFRLPIYFRLATLRGPVSLGDLVKAVTPSAIAGVAVAVAILSARTVLEQDLSSPLLGLAVMAAFAGLVALAIYCLIPRGRKGLASFADMLKMLRPTEPATT